jgi:AcrR family transcriptional regulator
MIEKPDTKSRILDAAEKLFGLNGFDATSLRDITTEAGVNLAAVNYHFQSKDSLIDAVMARRIEPVSRQRMAMLDAAGPHPSVEQILEAFLVPLVSMDLVAVTPLMGRMMSDPNQFVIRVFKKYLTPVSDRFHAEFHKALPELPLQELAWRIHFLAGIMTHLMTWSPVLAEFSKGMCDLSDRQAVVERIIAFAAAGFRTPLAEPAVNVEEPVASMERKG